MEMEKKKKDYEAPDIKVTQVEIESSICSGSGDDVEFGKQGANVTIQDQGVQIAKDEAGNTINDFSSSEWNVPDL